MNTVPYIYKARTVGLCFLAVFLAYGLGRYYFESDVLDKKYIGALLIVANSIMVILIGILLRKTLRQYNSTVGSIYLLARIFEGLVLGSVLLNLVTNLSGPINLTYFIAMLVLGLGSITMCFTFYQHKIIPNWLALWGLAGYTVFTFGFLMELFGKEWSMYFLGLAGLWEITFGAWLLFKKGRYE